MKERLRHWQSTIIGVIALIGAIICFSLKNNEAGFALLPLAGGGIIYKPRQTTKCQQ